MRTLLRPHATFLKLRWPLLLAMLAGMLLVQACEESSDDVSLPRITPTSVKLSAAISDQIVFTVEGGKPAYTWQVSQQGLGFIVAAENTAIYTSFAKSGQNFITVTDANSNAVTATVTQQ